MAAIRPGMVQPSTEIPTEQSRLDAVIERLDRSISQVVLQRQDPISIKRTERRLQRLDVLCVGRLDTGLGFRPPTFAPGLVRLMEFQAHGLHRLRGRQPPGGWFGRWAFSTGQHQREQHHREERSARGACRLRWIQASG